MALDRNSKCPKCQTSMEVGFIPEMGFGGIRSMWVEGLPEKGWSALKVKRRRTFEIATYRCTSCGYLEGYAT